MSRAGVALVAAAALLLAGAALAVVTRPEAGGPAVVVTDQAGREVASALVATEVGRRTLVMGDRQVPLFAPGGAPAHLVLSVRR